MSVLRIIVLIILVALFWFARDLAEGTRQVAIVVIIVCAILVGLSSAVLDPWRRRKG